MTGIDRLISHLSRLPGVGKKSAGRIAYYLLKADRDYVQRLAETIASLQDTVKKCSVCGNYTEEDPCPICSDSSRDRGIICVVEQPQDVHTIEQTAEYRGLYHVLGGAINPLEGIGPNNLSIAALMRRVTGGEVNEVILATNPTVEGDTTALYIHRMLQELDIPVSRLASGLPVGGDLEYADRTTLSRSFKSRTQM
ncbi:MAG: recombination mediator RecR [Spirochaetia bacterium]